MKDMQESPATTARRLNHVEFVHWPGEAGLVIDIFDAIGCSCHRIDTPPYGKYIVVHLSDLPHGENDMFVSEAEPEQLALDDALRTMLGGGHVGLATTGARFRQLRRERPYRVTHVGLRIPSVSALDRVIARLGALATQKLTGRLELGDVVSRSDDDAKRMSAPLKQLWVWTDVFSTGLLSIGQQIELQAYDY